jgi:hypothetical protein
VNPALFAAWVAGEAIVSWRIVHREHRLPAPGELLAITGLFVAGALVADVWPASAGVITAGLFGLDVAAFFNVWPQGFGGEVTQAETAAAQGGTAAGTGQSTGTTQAPGTSTAAGRG